MNVAVLGAGVTGTAVRIYIHYAPDMEETDVEFADLVVASPGIPPKNFPTTNVEIISEIEFAYRELKKANSCPKIIGITGTNGKTTVVSGVSHVNQIQAYGNIGCPFIEYLKTASSDDTIVLELSSFQLFLSPTLRCDYAIILNIGSDHLDWHDTRDNYVQSKLNIVSMHGPQRIYMPKDYTQSVTSRAHEGSIISAIEDLPICQSHPFKGEHNNSNMTVIQQISKDLGCLDAFEDRIHSFSLPRFRCEDLGMHGDLRIINDSKATNRLATEVALASIDGDVHLILAGQPKEPFPDAWMAKVLDRCKTVVACGYLAENKRQFAREHRKKMTFYKQVQYAVQALSEKNLSGTLLFSPAGASFDEFVDYDHRGINFNDYVTFFFTIR